MTLFSFFLSLHKIAIKHRLCKMQYAIKRCLKAKITKVLCPVQSLNSIRFPQLEHLLTCLQTKKSDETTKFTRLLTCLYIKFIIKKKETENNNKNYVSVNYNQQLNENS